MLPLKFVASMRDFPDESRRLEDIAVTNRDGEPVKLTSGRYRRLVGALKEFEGWSARLRSDFGADPTDFVVSHGLVETDVTSVDQVDAARIVSVPEGTLRTRAS